VAEYKAGHRAGPFMAEFGLDGREEDFLGGVDGGEGVGDGGSFGAVPAEAGWSLSQ